MAWASVTSETLTNVDDTEQKFAGIELSGGRHVLHVQIDATPPDTPADDLEVLFYSSPDGGTTVDEQPFDRMVVDRTKTNPRASRTVSAKHTVVVAVRALDAADLWPSVTLRAREGS